MLKKYNNYKLSGVEWLPTIPEEWTVVRNKEIFEERGLVSTNGEETLLTVSHITGVTKRSEKNVNMFMAETMEGYKICKTGDLLINTMWAWMGALGTSPEDGICSPAYGVYKPRKKVPYYHRFYDYLNRTPNSVVEMTRNSKGIVSSRLRLYPKEFFQIITVLPDYKTQKAIADYLDKKTAIIDRKIQLLEQKAEKYKQLKQSLISEAVTRGLDKNVALKDSGVEWIGMIPKHWEVRRLKDIGQSLIGITYTPEDLTDNIEGSLLVLRSSNIQDGKLCLEDNVYVKTTVSFRQILKKGDILICSRNGSRNLIGKNIVIDESVAGQTFGAFMSVYRTKFFQYTSNFFNSNLFEAQSGLFMSSTINQLTLNTLNNFAVPFPPYAEQIEIATYLAEKIKLFGEIANSINTQVTKLKELRKTLINDVVTGKIKVA